MITMCFLMIIVLCGFIFYLSWRVWQLNKWADEQIKLNHLLGDYIYENKKDIYDIKNNIYQ